MAWQRFDLKQRNILYADTDQPQKRQLISTMTPVGYEDEQGLIQPIDMAPQRVNNAQFNGWRIVNNGWHYGLETDGTNWFGGKRGQHFFKFRLSRIGYTNVEQGTKPDFSTDFTDIGGSPTYNTANLSFTPGTLALPDGEATISALAEWRDLWPALPAGEIYVRWALNGDRLKEEIVITQAAREWIAANRAPGYYGLAPSQTWLTFGFRVDWSDVPKRYRDGVDLTQSEDFTDAAGAIEGRTALDELLFYMPLDEAYVDNGDLIKPRVRLVKRFWRNSDGQWWLVVGAKVADLAALPAGDLVFDPTINASVNASNQDALITSFGLDLTINTLLFGHFAGYNDTESVMRFDVTGLDNGDTVDDAYLTVISMGNANFTSADGRIYCHDADTPSAPQTTAAYNALARTSASQAWTPGSWANAGASLNSPSFDAVVQEVVDRAGFTGQYMTVIVENDGTTGDDIAGWASWDHATYAAPTLTIEYTAGGPATQDVSASDSATLSSTSLLTETASLAAADQAALSEGLALQASTDDSDSAASTDTSALLLQIAANDTAAMTEGVAASVSTSTSDAAALVDTGALVQQNSFAAEDVAALTEAASLAVTATGVDTVSQTDASALNEAYQATDSALASEIASPAAAPSANDAALLTDTGQLGQSGGAGATDSATLTEAVALAVTATDTDAATATDTSTLGQALQATDSADVTEATSTTPQVTGADAFVNNESVTLTEARTLVATDTAALSEAATLSGGTDQIGNDSATLSETAALVIEVGSADTGTTDEAIAIALPAVDGAALSETVDAQVELSNEDSSTLSEQSTRTGGTTFSSNDSAALAETAALSVNAATVDAATLDTETTGQALADTDSLALEEVSVAAVALTGSDSAAVTDTGSRDAGASPTGVESFALTEAVTLAIVSASSDSANLSESQSTTEAQTATDSGSLSETSSLQMMVDHQGQETGTLTESVSIVVTLASNDSAAGVEQPLPEGYLADDESATFSDSGEVVTGIYHTGSDGFWLTESALLEAHFQRVDSALLTAAIIDRSLGSAEIYQLTDLAYGVGEGELPDTVIPGTFYHMLLLAHWQKVSGEVFKWRDAFWYAIQDNDRIVFKQVAFEPDLHHPFWGKYRGPVGLLKDEA